MIRHYKMRSRRNLQSFRRNRNSLLFHLIDFLEKSFRVDDHSVSEHTDFIFVNNSRRQKPENKRLFADINRMPGIMSALITRDNIEAVSQQIDNFSFSLVAPLSANYNNYHLSFIIYHFFI